MYAHIGFGTRDGFGVTGKIKAQPTDLSRSVAGFEHLLAQVWNLLHVVHFENVRCKFTQRLERLAVKLSLKRNKNTFVIRISTSI
jgi:hypothetical protein